MRRKLLKSMFMFASVLVFFVMSASDVFAISRDPGQSQSPLTIMAQNSNNYRGQVSFNRSHKSQYLDIGMHPEAKFYKNAKKKKSDRFIDRKTGRPYQYRDGMSLYAGYFGERFSVDPSGLVCGVSIHQKNESGGHQWIEFKGGSAGFWPAGSIWGGPAKVRQPDTYAGQRKDVTTWNPKKKKHGEIEEGPGKGKKCCDATCADITGCLMAKIGLISHYQKTYNVITFNCRTFTNILQHGCCLTTK